MTVTQATMILAYDIDYFGLVLKKKLLVQHLLRYHYHIFFFQSGKTPLFFAAHGGDRGVCELLVSRGADVNALDKTQVSVHFDYVSIHVC